MFQFVETKGLLPGLDTSCPLNRCETGWICSIRLNGNYSCDCPPGYFGSNCQNSLLLLLNKYNSK